MNATELQKIETKAKTRFWYFKLSLGLCMLWGIVGPAITWGISVNLLPTALFLGIAGVLAAAYIPVIAILAAATLYTGYTAYKRHVIYQRNFKSSESPARNQLNELRRGDNLTAIEPDNKETKEESNREKSTPISESFAEEGSLDNPDISAFRQESAATFSDPISASRPMPATIPNSITEAIETMYGEENFLKSKKLPSFAKVSMLNQLISEFNEFKSINSNDPSQIISELIGPFRKLTSDFKEIYCPDNKFSQPPGRSDEDTIFDTLLYFKAQKALMDIRAQEPFANSRLFTKRKDFILEIKLYKDQCFALKYESKGLFFSNEKFRTDEQVKAIHELISINKDAQDAIFNPSSSTSAVRVLLPQ